MNRDDFDKWLKRYGDAWETRDRQAFTEIFDKNVQYCWTPFEEPKTGSGELADAFVDATTTQSDIQFSYNILSLEKGTGVAHWRCDLKRTTTGDDVTIDGILLCEFNEAGSCTLFREWWHTTEER